MKSYSVLVGSNNTRGRFSRRDEALLQKITAQYYPEGFTILTAAGSWFDPVTQQFRKEEARQVIVSTNRARSIPNWCQAIGVALRQKELIVQELGSARRIQIRTAKAGRARDWT